jgi:phage recombination protein Bet
MSTELQAPPVAAPPVTTDQLDLIKRTVAHGATADELKLYLFDCARQGVHPLDKLVHFTKRGGKYTPVTSIDFMRIRAAETGEYAGSDDAFFNMSPPMTAVPGGPPSTATVTVYRLVQGQRCSFTGTARWEEYKPEQNDFMWRKMPHTMLSKCAEALALRKGFPRQLAGLYAREEMDQAETPVPPGAEDLRKPQMGGYATVPAPPPDVAPLAQLPEGFCLIERIDSAPTKNPKVLRFRVTLSTGEVAATINPMLASLAENCCQERIPVRVKLEQTRWGPELKSITREKDLEMEPDDLPLTSEDIPF